MVIDMLTTVQKIEKLLWYIFERKQLCEKHKKRLEWEIKEIEIQGKSEYFLNLFKEKKKFPKNENNILVPYILGIVDDFDINKDPKFVQGDMPDIDVDYLSEVRDYLKNKWASETFGKEYVCNIGNYTTFGMKSALIDMARVHGEARGEILELTKELEAKDDEGKPLTWDVALSQYPKLKDYCEKYPDVSNAAKRLINRNRGMGQHAGGLIISSIPLHDLVPLVKRKDNPQASAWVEGLNGQDLQPVGLVKFDLLVISNLMQISKCCELVKRRKSIDSICAMPNQSDWTDIIKWRNDSKALEMANEGDLKCIFQFDSEGIRKLVRSGGVDSFEDLVAYTALYRPGPLNMKMHERYIERKKGNEEYSLHPLVEPILGKTYGVMVFQEQIMKILNVVGEIPFRDCEIVRKAISKKKAEAFKKYEIMFIEKGQKNLNISEKEAINLFDQIKSFAEYGFNLSHSVAYTYVSSRLLYLKAHYPHEFYAAVLSCETLSEKIKDYKMEAKKHNIEMHKIDINKSKKNFELIDDVIYYGLSNIKGVGEAPAEKIVSGQPYNGFGDFLFKFGTDASVIKCLIGLRCFDESDPITLWKFYEHYKECARKIEDKKKRFAVSMLQYEEEFKELFPDETRLLNSFHGTNPFDGDEWEKYDVNEMVESERKFECEKGEGEPKLEINYVSIEGTEDFIEVQKTRYYKITKTNKVFNRLKELKKLWVRNLKSIERLEDSKKLLLPTIETFNPNDYEIDRIFKKELKSIVACEIKYYGFAWTHNLEKSKDFKGYTFEAFKENIGCICPVEVEIVVRKMCKSKKGTTYCQLEVEDALGEKNKINIWEDDFKRWDSELKKGNLVRLRLQSPDKGFPTYTLEQNKKLPNQRWVYKFPTKETDYRVYLMKSAEVEKDKYLSEEEILEQFSNYEKEEKNV